MTGQPDFGRLEIEYVPDEFLVETKSLKMFLWSFRERAAFNEHLVDEICRSFYTQISPQWVRVSGSFHPRGGISVKAIAWCP